MASRSRSLAFVAALVLIFFLVRDRVNRSVFDWRTCPGSQALPTAGLKVLVTGAAGFIGSHTARACDALGMDVVAVDDLSGGFYENIPTSKRVTFIKGDVKDPVFLEQLFKEHGPFEYVYHLAAYAAEGLSHFIPSYNYRNNLVGSVEVLSQAVKHGTKVFVFTSSIAVYGTVQDTMREDVIPQPEDPYGISKYSMELHLKTAHALHGIDYVIFRPHNVYGPNQNIADKYRNVVGIFMNQILNDQPMSIFGDGEQTRSFSYVDDVAPIIAKSPLYPHARNQIFNVGADRPYSLNDLATAVAKAMGAERKVVHLEQRHEVVHAKTANDKVRCYFQLPTPTPLDVGLKATAQWVKTIGKAYQPVEFKNVEVMNHMPPSWKRPSLGEAAFIEHTSADNPRVVEVEKERGRSRS
eukprot:TRINITY_DN41426_c0_g1_i1.p1 TRINITY_DN41426_c0_g1~~TRINITY_DN41426_c0_g1_i1.p1  ORF type:complete len:410 (+),score=58.73 TRINITY_DN41426_c0_g1_i1:38-1267(+)